MRAFRIVLAAAAIAALTASAQAQMGQGLMSGASRQNDRPGGAPPPQEKQAPRSNEKDYKSSLGRLPDKKYDPWANTR